MTQATDGNLPSRRQRKDNAITKASPALHDDPSRVPSSQNSKKRKRDSATGQDADPKLKEFLDVMQPPKKSKSWRDEAIDQSPVTKPSQAVKNEDADSADEYQSISKPKRQKKENTVPTADSVEEAAISHDQEPPEDANSPEEPANDRVDPEQEAQPAQSDADWLRNRTSRLLGLLDEREEEQHLPKKTHDAVPEAPELSQDDERQVAEGDEDDEDETAEPEGSAETKIEVDPDEEAIRTSKRLFLRNLPYGVNEDHLREAFAPFGNLEEVHHLSFPQYALFLSMMIPDRDNLCFGS